MEFLTKDGAVADNETPFTAPRGGAGEFGPDRPPRDMEMIEWFKGCVLT